MISHQLPVTSHQYFRPAAFCKKISINLTAPTSLTNSLTLLDFVLANSFFTFEGLHYKLIFGFAMGSPISATIKSCFGRKRKTGPSTPTSNIATGYPNTLSAVKKYCYLPVFLWLFESFWGDLNEAKVVYISKYYLACRFVIMTHIWTKCCLSSKKSGTSHGEISVSCTSQECDVATQFSLCCRPLSTKWSLTGGWKHEKIYFKLLALKVVAFAYKSWSLTRVIWLGKCNTFDILENWSPARGGSGGSTVINFEFVLRVGHLHSSWSKYK